MRCGRCAFSSSVAQGGGVDKPLSATSLLSLHYRSSTKVQLYVTIMHNNSELRDFSSRGSVDISIRPLTAHTCISLNPAVCRCFAADNYFAVVAHECGVALLWCWPIVGVEKCLSKVYRFLYL